MKKFRELKEEVSTPPIGVRSLYTKMYAKHGGTAAKTKDAQSKAYAEVEKKHGKDMRNSLEAFHKKNMNEEVVNEISDTTLASYKEKAKASADKLESEKKYGDALKRRVGVLNAVGKMVGRAGEKIGKLAKEEAEQLDELSPETKSSYMQKAKKEVKELKPHTKGEYGDIAKNIIKRREKGIAMAKEETEDTHWSKSGKEAVHRETGKKTYEYREYKKGEQTGRREYRDEKGKPMGEEVESLEEKNVPTSPEKWAQAKAQAKAKFDVYPSAYANGWAAKKYKEMGGGWKSVSEEVEQIDEILRQDNAKSFVGYDAKKEKDDLPFTPDKPRKQNVIPGKHGAGYSTARHLARMAMQKQSEKIKKPIKEEEMSKKAQIVKNVMKKKKESADAFQKDPIISKTEVKM